MNLWAFNTKESSEIGLYLIESSNAYLNFILKILKLICILWEKLGKHGLVPVAISRDFSNFAGLYPVTLGLKFDLSASEQMCEVSEHVRYKFHGFQFACHEKFCKIHEC